MNTRALSKYLHVAGWPLTGRAAHGLAASLPLSLWARLHRYTLEVSCGGVQAGTFQLRYSDGLAAHTALLAGALGPGLAAAISSGLLSDGDTSGSGGGRRGGGGSAGVPAQALAALHVVRLCLAACPPPMAASAGYAGPCVRRRGAG
eukprot:COSAG01_NODE_14037_length_1504_cov_1.223488_3_plen_147_part_00